MFGGLEVKGSVDSTKKADSSPHQDEAETSQSAFSFLNSISGTTTTTAPTNVTAQDPSFSAFSFLYPSTENAATENGARDASNIGSSFGFMTSVKADAPVVNNNDVENSIATSFSFLQQPISSSSNVTISEPEDVHKDANSEPESSSITSAFSFLGAPTLEIKDVSQPALSADMFSTMTAGKSSIQEAQPAGSGVSFANAASSASTVKKKRTRTAVVGAMAHQQPQQTIPEPPPLPSSLPLSVSDKASQHQISSSSASTNDDTTHKSALEASRRVEEFISEKIKSSTFKHEEEDANASSSGKHLSTVSSVDSDDPDGIIAAAKAAVEEAHKMESKSRNPSILSGLFRSRTSPPTSRHNSVNNLSSASPVGSSFRKTISKSSSDEQHNFPQIPTSVSRRSGQSLSQEAVSSMPMSESERLRREHEHVQQAISKQMKYDIGPHDLNVEKTVIPEDYVHSGRPIAVIPVPLPPSASSWKQPIKVANVDILSVPCPPTPREKCSAMISQFRESVILALNEIEMLRDHRRGLLEEQHVTSAKARLAEQQKAAAETQQMAAAEAEEFEMADEMSVVIEKYQREKIEYNIILDNIRAALNQFEIQKEACIKRITSCFNEVQHGLKEFRKDTESLDTNDATEKREQFAAVSKVLSAENERLQQDWKHLERDASLVADERKEVEKAISLQSGEHEKERDAARGKLVTVEEEIEELRKQLTIKQNVAAQLRTEAAGHDEAILKVRVKFSRQLNRVQKKEMEIQDTQREWEIEKSNVDLQRQAHEFQMSSHSEALLARDQLLETLVHEIEIADTFETIIVENQSNFFDVLKQNEDKDSRSGNNVSTLGQMQADVVKAEAAKNEAQIVLKSASTTLANLEEESKRLEGSLPMLEEMKKGAAIRRDFKAAGVASKEIKEAITRMKEIKDDLLDDAKEKLTNADLELAKREKELLVAVEIATEKENQSCIEAMYKIAETLKELFALKKGVCANQAENINVEVIESDPTILSVGCLVLDEQIKALHLEGQALGDKIEENANRWDDILSEVAGISPPVTDEPDCEKETASPEPSLKAALSNLAEETKEESAPVSVSCVVEKACSGKHGNYTSIEDKLVRFRDLTERLKDVEDKLEQAVAGEDFDEAAALDEALQKVLNNMAELDMTEEEVEIALSAEPRLEQEIVTQATTHLDDCQDEIEQNPLPDQIDEETDEPILESPTMISVDSEEVDLACDNEVAATPTENNLASNENGDIATENVVAPTNDEA